MVNSKYNSVFVHLIILLKLANAIEPKCSSYDYDERILERMVRIELKFDNAMKTIEGTEESVWTRLVDLKEDRDNIKTELTELTKLVKETVQEAKIEINKTLSFKTSEFDEFVKQQQSIITQMTNDLIQLRNETIDVIKKATKLPNIAFRASLSTYSTKISAGTILIFPDVRVNHGNGYDVTTGHFTAPVTGTYLVTVQVCSQYSRAIEVNLVVDGSVQTEAYYRTEGYSICYTTTDVMHLQIYNEVWVSCGGTTTSSNVLYNDSQLQTFFAAVLVNI